MLTLHDVVRFPLIPRAPGAQATLFTECSELLSLTRGQERPAHYVIEPTPPSAHHSSQRYVSPRRDAEVEGAEDDREGCGDSIVERPEIDGEERGGPSRGDEEPQEAYGDCQLFVSIRLQKDRERRGTPTPAVIEELWHAGVPYAPDLAGVSKIPDGFRWHIVEAKERTRPLRVRVGTQGQGRRL